MSNLYLKPFEAIVDFLADFLGENAEVVLHDLSDLEQSIYKIRNGHISGRKVGDPVTDLVAKVLHINDDNVKYHCNYRGTLRDNTTAKCATYYIRDENNTIVGAMCINLALDEFIKARDMLNNLLKNIDTGASIEEEAPKENLGMTVPEMIDARIAETVASYGSDGSKLTQQDKKALIVMLNGEGVFLLRGSVAKVAKALGMSEPTVYKYLQQSKANA